MSSNGHRGHVFVVQGDLAALACDDVLVPTDREGHVTAGFHALLEGDLEPGGGFERRVGTDQDLGGDPVLVQGGDEGPRRWLVDTVTGEVAQLVVQVERWVAAAVACGEGARPRHGRAKRLLGMPLVGTGEGGAAGRRGDVLAALLPVLNGLTRQRDVDIALVLADPRDFSAAQEVRRRCADDWPLGPELLERADRLADLARRGELALFVGAGVSRAAGLPMWDEMLSLLADAAGVDDRERERLTALPPPDVAQLLHRRLGEEAFAAQVRAMFDRREHALAHALLAALPVPQAVTTNYDPLLESAYAAARRTLRVLPSGRGPGGTAGTHADAGRSDADSAVVVELVKLHGDVSRPEEVVLTRESYVRLTDERTALAGVVQALLLTRHVLFVGFSLLDDTFIRVAHQTHRVLARETRVGTALGLRDDPIRRELWEADLDYVSVAGSDTPLPEAARLLEIFLDRLAASSASRYGWLLDPRYAGLRTEPDSALANAVDVLLTGLGADARSSPGWPALGRALEHLGAAPEASATATIGPESSG